MVVKCRLLGIRSDMHGFMELSRKNFLLLGASGAATAAGGVLGTGVAFGAPPPATPQGDDLGFLAFGAVCEGAARAFYRQALATPGLFDAGERRHLKTAFSTHDKAVALGMSLE